MGTEPIEGTTITLNLQPSPGFKPNCFNLIGRIITDKELKFRAIKNSILGMWGNPKDVSISEVGRNKVLISFKDSKLGMRFLRNGPWNVRGNLMNLQRWLYGEAILDVRHDHMEFWIQVHGIPIELLNKETAKTIAELIGIVGEVEDPMKDGTLKRNYLRCRAAINITQPLQTGFWLNRDNKSKTWISFKYERLQDCFCLKCGIIGHEKKNCSKPIAMACWDPSKPRYTNELAAERARSLNIGEEEEKWEQHLKEQEEAREYHTTEAEGGNSQSIEDRVKDQGILDIPEIEVSSGKARMEEKEKIGGEEMEETREANPLTQGRGSEDREMCILNLLEATLRSIKEIKGKRADKTNEVMIKEKERRAEMEIIKGVSSIAGPSNWNRPNDTFTNEANKTTEQAHQKLVNFHEANKKGSTKTHPYGSQATSAIAIGDHKSPFTPQERKNQVDCLKSHSQGPWRQSSENEGKRIGMDNTWTMRDEPKKRINVDNHKKKHSYKNEKGQTYYVELASEDEEDESNASNQVNNNIKIWEEVLSIGMQYNLKIKRKREEREVRNMEEANWDEDRVSRNTKRIKNMLIQEGGSREVAEQGTTITAEEAGLIKPHPQP
ncbi:hypothetical protein Ahy_B10g105597 [Arachis hypogaea]|uniref:CCHC-type domain-containing protein n=1 Tax=Arachis hypogaea TaxID=3818 RepID=A0A444X8F4_ARAHY|nr:hypothetical protein Ahy_B10g105597 [Arachis hypogaea]